MKKLLLNVVCGVIIAILTMSLVTSILGIVFVNNGYIEFMIEELFTNIEMKILMVNLGGIAIGISSYLNSKYEENNKVLSKIFSMIGIIILVFLINLTNYTIVFKIAYLSILCLVICILEFTKYISTKKDIDVINKRLQKDKREEK